MSEFKREARYIVIKTSDLAKVPTAYRSDLVDPLSRLQAHLPNRDFVVVESDWPEYEPVWQMIEARMNGEPNALDAELAREASETLRANEAERREAALREELETEKRANHNAKVALKAASETCELWKGRTTSLTQKNAALQQRLTDAEKRLSQVEGACDLAMSAIDDDERGANFVNIIQSIKGKAELKPAEVKKPNYQLAPVVDALKESGFLRD